MCINRGLIDSSVTLQNMVLQRAHVRVALITLPTHNISITDSRIVNKPGVQGLEVELPTLLTILMVNIMSIMLIKKRENTLVNNLLTLDCVANAVLTLINVINEQSLIVGFQLYCTPVTVLYSRYILSILHL